MDKNANMVQEAIKTLITIKMLKLQGKTMRIKEKLVKENSSV